ncbi:MAG: cupin domain-containing protein [Rhodocyclaceae bacterium]|nr:cupin domain-containing protein [Rhodocyclaceae bacterium]
MHKNRQPYAEVQPYITLDGSEIRELMHPGVQGNQAQSLAEATVFPGKPTRLHRHRETEELYHILEGRGVMRLGDEEIPVEPGDTVCILPGMPHRVSAEGGVLRLLCCCAPAYRHEDTELLE